MPPAVRKKHVLFAPTHRGEAQGMPHAEAQRRGVKAIQMGTTSRPKGRIGWPVSELAKTRNELQLTHLREFVRGIPKPPAPATRRNIN